MNVSPSIGYVAVSVSVAVPVLTRVAETLMTLEIKRSEAVLTISSLVGAQIAPPLMDVDEPVEISPPLCCVRLATEKG
jgi:hypothetical protein